MLSLLNQIKVVVKHLHGYRSYLVIMSEPGRMCGLFVPHDMEENVGTNLFSS